MTNGSIRKVAVDFGKFDMPVARTPEAWRGAQNLTLVDEIEDNYKVDKNRIYLTGLSMGGFGTWALASYDQHRFAAIVPICGGGEVYTTARRLGKTPTWVFHGAKDPIVPLERSEVLVEALNRKNEQVKFTVYPEAGHDSWSETYNTCGSS